MTRLKKKRIIRLLNEHTDFNLSQCMDIVNYCEFVEYKETMFHKQLVRATNNFKNAVPIEEIRKITAKIPKFDLDN